MSIRARLVNWFLRLFRKLGWIEKFTPLLEDPEQRPEVLAKIRRGDRREPPRRLLKDRGHEVVQLDTAPVHLLGHPEEPGRRVLLYLHGGGYVTGPNPPHWAAMDEITREASADLAMLLYPRSPEHPWHEAIGSAAAAYDHLEDRYGAANVVVAGDSAGGGLTARLLMAIRDAGGPQPHSAILISPWLDLTASEPGVGAQAPTDLMLTINVIRTTGRLHAGDLDPSDGRVSPLNGSTHDLAPMHVFVGTDELFLPECRAFVAKARANGHPVTIREMSRGQHVSAIYPTPEGRIARAQMVALMGWP